MIQWFKQWAPTKHCSVLSGLTRPVQLMTMRCSETTGFFCRGHVVWSRVKHAPQIKSVKSRLFVVSWLMRADKCTYTANKNFFTCLHCTVGDTLLTSLINSNPICWDQFPPFVSWYICADSIIERMPNIAFHIAFRSLKLNEESLSISRNGNITSCWSCPQGN